MRTAIFLSFLLCGCVAPHQILVNDRGQFVRCAFSGFGIFGAPLAYRTVNKCVEDFEALGYKKVKSDE